MTSQSQTQPKHSIFELLAALAAIGILAVAAYSIYVATHEPDPQETVLLGQTRVAVGSPAGFRVVVRNRVTGRMVQGANVEIALASKTSKTTKLGSFLTDASGAYDGSLSINDQLRCSVTVKNNTDQRINMAIVDLGIPPGFEVDETSFERRREKDQIAKFESTGAQVILYLRELSNLSPFKFDYDLRAKYPLRVQAPPSAVYEYYQPKNRAEAKGVTLEAL